MLIAVSFSFIAFTIPYQICWYWLFSTALGSVELNLKVNIINIGLRYLALTIRNLNYTLNFFLYSLTSFVFLKEAFTIAHCNYFLSQTFFDRHPKFRGLRRLFSLPDEQREQQPINVVINQVNSNNINYQSFPKHLNSNKDNEKISNHLLNGHLNLNTTQTNVSINLKQIKTKPKQKKIKWNLKPINNNLSSNHYNYNDDDYDDDDDDEEQQQQLQLSSNFTSTSNLNEINNKVQE